MKQSVLFYLALLVISSSLAQVGIGTVTPDPSSQLDISATNKGLLVPNISLSDASDTMLDGVNVAADGLLIYNTNAATIGGNGIGYYYFNGTTWERLITSATPSANAWSLIGNPGTTPATNFLGTTDNQAVSIRTNNTEKLRLTPNGQLEIFNTGNSIFIGENAGDADDLSGKTNVFVGKDAGISNLGTNSIGIGMEALQSAAAAGVYNIGIGTRTLGGNINGTYNLAMGYESSLLVTGGSFNVALGYQALRQTASGMRNVAIGHQAGWNISGNDNIAIGDQAIRDNGDDNNVAIGAGTGFFNQMGSSNTFLGYQAGYGTSIHNKSGSLFLGHQAGFNEQNSNRLYIDNSSTTTPLIYGEFDTDLLRFGANTYIGSSNAAAQDLYIANRVIDWDNSSYSMDLGSDSFMNEISFDTGSSGDVSIYFGDTNSGFFSPNTSEVGYSVNGTEKMRIDGTGRMKLYDTDDASGTVGTGVLEIANALRLDGNEIITNTGNTLFLQFDNGGDLNVDNQTLYVDATNNRVGVNNGAPAFTLDVSGTANITGAIYQSGAIIHPDHVFEYYFDGTSKFNPSYRLESLREIESYLRKYKHLPGVQSREEVLQNKWNLSEGVRDNLEKVEELYLHAIEANGRINTIIKENKDLKKRLLAQQIEINEIKKLLLEKDN